MERDQDRGGLPVPAHGSAAACSSLPGKSHQHRVLRAVALHSLYHGVTTSDIPVRFAHP
jgi:hypothetical protein